MKPEIPEDRVCRYLLSDLPEAEQLALEQEFLTDGDAFERVWEIENRLVDGYVRGKLTGREGELFERNYLASQVHRERVAFARNLIEAADSTSESVQEQPRTLSPVALRRSSFTPLKREWRWAMIAAMLVLGLASIGLFVTTTRLQRQIGHMNEERATEAQRTEELEREVEGLRQRGGELTEEIERLRAQSQNAEHTSTGPDQGQPLLSFLLSPMLMRSGGDAQQLKVARDTRAVVLRMKAPDSEPRSFQVVLRTVEGAEIWTRDSIKAQALPKCGSLVSATIPAAKLGAADYILTLFATRSGQDAEEINRYFFRVVRE